MFALRKYHALENILKLVDKQMQGAPIIGTIMISKTDFAALVGSSCEKPMIWVP